ncbi:MAG TPA: serine/threonine-protein kinase [Vicinamibacterales bacterium]|nr:serine/threonine-protein kinase [Vicinamibacterales bacterium]
MTTIVGRYRVLDLLGAGGMGVVYRADDLTLRRVVALKFLAAPLASDQEHRARFLREARIAASLNHPNTCVVYEVGELDTAVALSLDDSVVGAGTPFIVMEFVEGDTLAAMLERSGPLSARATIGIALQLAEGLAEAHARQIVHRDLKPHNVMITPNGRVKIVDFGLAKPLRSFQKATLLVSTSEMISANIGDGAVIGTCAYMSPEQAAGKPLDARSDVFSFGTIIYQMLAGRLPFEGDTATETIAKILEADPAPWPQTATGVADSFAHIVTRCLRKKPGDRYPDAGMLLGDLRQIEPTVSGDVRASGWTRTALVSVGCLILALVVTYLLVLRTDDAWVASAPRAPGAVSASSQERVPSPPLSPQKPAATDLDDGRPGAATLQAVSPVQLSRPRDAAPGAPTSASPSASVSPDRIAERASQTTVGTLTVRSVPRSSVNVDGNLTGVTPLALEVSAGTHEIVLTGPDGLRWRGRIAVAAGEASALDRDLALTGSLSVVSDVWAEVSLDGGPPEQTPIHFDRVAAGLHTLRVFRDGYVTQDREIVIEEGRASSHRITLEKNP